MRLCLGSHPPVFVSLYAVAYKIGCVSTKAVKQVCRFCFRLSLSVDARSVEEILCVVRLFDLDFQDRAEISIGFCAEVVDGAWAHGCDSSAVGRVGV